MENRQTKETERALFSAAVHVLDNADPVDVDDVITGDCFLVTAEDFEELARCLQEYRQARQNLNFR